MRKIINREQMLEVLETLRNKSYFDLDFKRVTPKCINCGEKSNDWKESEISICPKCGGLIDYDCHAEKIVFGKDDFQHHATCEGNMNRGMLLYLDKTKGFRNARLTNIYRIKTEENEYFIV